MKKISLLLIALISLMVAACAKPKAELTVSKNQIRKGESVAVNWQTDKAKEILLNGEKVAKNGTQVFQPEQTTQFELIGKRGKKSARDSETVTVEVLPASPQVSIKVDRAVINQGEKTILRWSSERAESVEISQLGRLAASGEREILPAESTTYTALAKGPGGEASASTRVTVSQIDREKPNQPLINNSGFDPSKAIKSIYFEFDSAELQPAAKSALNRNATILLKEENKAEQFRIEGNCDPRGSEEYNLALGDRRANETKSYLITQGIDPSRMDVISNGRRFATGNLEGDQEQAPSWAHDRRADTIFMRRK